MGENNSQNSAKEVPDGIPECESHSGVLGVNRVRIRKDRNNRLARDGSADLPRQLDISDEPLVPRARQDDSVREHLPVSHMISARTASDPAKTRSGIAIDTHHLRDS
jgi:hypothetical protein